MEEPGPTRSNEDQRRVIAHLRLGHARLANNQFQLAMKHFGKAVEISKQLEDREQEIDSLYWLGHACLLNNQVQTAIQYLDKSLEIAKEHGYKHQEGRILIHLGKAYNMKDEFQTAIKNLEEALKIAKEQLDKNQEANAFYLLGDVYTSKPETLETAIEKYKEALKIAKEHGYKELETMVLLDLGLAYRLSSQFPAAIEYWEKALKIANEQQDRNNEAEALSRLGDACVSNNQFQMAIEFLEKGLKIAKEQEYRKIEARASFFLGEAYKFKFQFQKAMKYYQNALRIAEEHGYRSLENMARNAVQEWSMTVDLDTENDTLQTLPSTSDLAQLQDTQHENVHNVDQTDETRNSAEQLLNNSNSSNGVPVQNTQHESVVNVDHVEINNESVREETTSKTISAERLSVLGSSFQNEDLETHNDTHQTLPNTSDVAQLQDENVQKSPELWKWEESSKVHRIKFVSLQKRGKIHPKDIQVVNGVRFCCSEEFLVGMGSDGTRVYVGLAEDGYERAVKCMRKDACAGLAEQEKIVLNKSNAKKSNHVVRYWFLDDKSDRHYLFLILDLCEETLETFITNSNLKDLVTIAPDIIQQILKGLVDLHREPLSILHRDLKPSNILHSVDGYWLLADFGISRMLRKGASTHLSNQKGTEDWRAVESSYTSTGIIDNGTVRYKKKSDIQVAGIVAFYIVTKGEHPFGEKRYRLDNLLEGKPVGLNTLKDPVAKDLIFWMLNHDPKDRPSAEEALKHPYLQSKKQQFEMLCKVGNQQEIKTGDINSPVVQNLNNDPTNWQTQIGPDVLNYLCIDFTNKKPKGFCYEPSWTDCLRLIRNVNQHWHDQPRPLPQPEAFYVVGDPKEYFLTRFPNLPVVVHGIVRSCDWRERPDLKEYFM